MEKMKYKELVAKNTPKENYISNSLIAFITGGLMGVLGELLLELYSYVFNISANDASCFMIITLIFI